MAIIFGPETFEGGSKGTFDSEVEYNGTVDFDSSSKIRGTYSAKCTTTGTSGTAHLYETFGSTYTKLYYQFKILLPSDWAWTTGSACSLITVYDSTPAWIFTLSMENWDGSSNPPRLLMNGAMGYTSTGLTLTKGVVHTIEICVDKTVGVKIWMDNKDEASPNYTYSGTAISADMKSFSNGLIWGDNAIPSFYIDNVTVSTTFIGPPTNLKVNISDVFKTVKDVNINIGDSWKQVDNIYINVGDTWKTVF